MFDSYVFQVYNKDKNMNKEKKRKPESRQKRAKYRLISNLLLWILIAIPSSVLFGADDLAGLAIFIIIIGFNLATTDVLRHYVRQHDRNVIPWTTASLVFTPILAGIVYLLTWPKDKKLTGLEG